MVYSSLGCVVAAVVATTAVFSNQVKLGTITSVAAGTSSGSVCQFACAKIRRCLEPACTEPIVDVEACVQSCELAPDEFGAQELLTEFTCPELSEAFLVSSCAEEQIRARCDCGPPACTSDSDCGPGAVCDASLAECTQV